jgi:hypothetical protein
VGGGRPKTMWKRRYDPESSIIQRDLRKAKAEYASTTAEAQRKMAVIVESSVAVRYSKYLRIAGTLLILASAVVSIWYFGFWAFAASLAAVIAYLSATGPWVIRVRERAKHRLSAELRPHEITVSDAVFALRLAEKRYDRQCELSDSYPPDWRARRETLLKRDGNKSTSCGWPDGVRRKRRELQIHHIISLAKGGDNSLSNLTTLCHICHRNVDSDHSGVHAVGKRKRKDNW